MVTQTHVPLVKRFFTNPGWDFGKAHPSRAREAVVTRADGSTKFQQSDVMAPDAWSDKAVATAASKYFHGAVGSPKRETSVYQMIDRVAKTTAAWAGFMATAEEMDAIRQVDGDIDRLGICIHEEMREARWTCFARPDNTRQPSTQVYFETYDEWRTFLDELTEILLTQRAAFNSPVWFNVGVDGPTGKGQQCSACFINRVEDYMCDEGPFGILDLPKTEGKLFKKGSGSGTEISRLRSSREQVTAGGHASGAVSFSRGWSASAGEIKSGGTVRRVAIMRSCMADYGDIYHFVEIKAHEEEKARALAAAGFGTGLDSESYQTVAFQNENLSVRVSDEFMKAVREDGDWELVSRTLIGKPDDAKVKKNMLGDDGYVIETIKARELFRRIAESAWKVADPGIQFDSRINSWHTCPSSDRIHSSNPCSEFMFLDNTACNLASLNLMKFLHRRDGKHIYWDDQAFLHTINVMITAMEVFVSNAAYPHEVIAEMSHHYRPLGIGFSNLGSVLISMGLPYDSDEACLSAGAISSFLTAAAYAQSSRMASRVGPFPGLNVGGTDNYEPMLAVMKSHRKLAADAVDTLGKLHENVIPDAMAELFADSLEHWDISIRAENGWRNSQASALAPTGTIALLMDCETTGIEPPLAAVQYKKLVGGGQLVTQFTAYEEGLRCLGREDIHDILAHLNDHGNVDDYNFGFDANEKLRKLFETSFPPYHPATKTYGRHCLRWEAHVGMMAAVQPFISGAISKTVNMPGTATVEEIENVYMMAWGAGLKSIAVYRDGCKMFQPVSTKSGETLEEQDAKITQVQTSVEKLAEVAGPEVRKALQGRRKPARRRRGYITKFRVGGHKGYMIAGEDENGDILELFVRLGDQGSAVNSWADAFCIMFSYAIQYGAPLPEIVRKLKQHGGDPSGFTDDPEIRNAPSIPAYLMRRIGTDYLPFKVKAELGLVQGGAPEGPQETAGEPVEVEEVELPSTYTGLVCGECGGFNVALQGPCLYCLDCNWSQGGCAG